MGRLWLALALLAALVSTATAKPACTCRTEVLLPKPGATGVPTNARFWRITSMTSTPDQPIQVYELAPHTTYDLSASAALVIFVIVTAVGWDAATKVMRFASYDGAAATVRGDEVTVEVGGKNATLRAAAWRIRRARDHAIPRATL